MLRSVIFSFPSGGLLIWGLVLVYKPPAGVNARCRPHTFDLVFTACMTDLRIRGVVTFFKLPGAGHPILHIVALSAILFSVACYRALSHLKQTFRRFAELAEGEESAIF